MPLGDVSVLRGVAVSSDAVDLVGAEAPVPVPSALWMQQDALETPHRRDAPAKACRNLSSSQHSPNYTCAGGPGSCGDTGDTLVSLRERWWLLVP